MIFKHSLQKKICEGTQRATVEKRRNREDKYYEDNNWEKLLL